MAGKKSFTEFNGTVTAVSDTWYRGKLDGITKVEISMVDDEYQFVVHYDLGCTFSTRRGNLATARKLYGILRGTRKSHPIFNVNHNAHPVTR